MTTQTHDLASQADVPDGLRDLYNQARRSPEVRAARGAYYTHEPDPTTEGAERVMHQAAMAVVDQRRAAYEAGAASVAAINQVTTCPICGGNMGVGLTRSGLCRGCTVVVDRKRDDRLEAEIVVDGKTRGELAAAWLEEHP
jgi:hypothetical protein